MTYRSEDGNFEVTIEPVVVERLLGHCRRAAGFETGGVLVGTYQDGHRCALVTDLSGPPQGSKHGRSNFYRAVGKLQGWMDALWSRREGHYLGEWHYHPGGTSEPSGTDRDQLKKIAADVSYVCPEPILIILGGDPMGTRSFSVSIFTREGKELYLKCAPDGHST